MTAPMIRQLLGAHTRLEAVSIAARAGLITLLQQHAGQASGTRGPISG